MELVDPELLLSLVDSDLSDVLEYDSLSLSDLLCEPFSDGLEPETESDESLPDVLDAESDTEFDESELPSDEPLADDELLESVTTEYDMSDEAGLSLVDPESLDADSDADEDFESLPLDDGVLDDSELVLEDSLSLDEPLSLDKSLLDDST
ncbi:MAG: hypothetical protein AAFV88_06570 [Planctomycetota bacterium]